MGSQDDRQHTRRERIDRLRKRVEAVWVAGNTPPELIGVLKGILDLLGDEL